MPKNKSGVGIDPADYNRNDGFSPGQPIVVHIPGMDSQKAFNKCGIVPVDNIRKYADPAQPVVVIDAATGARNPIFAEMDAHATEELGPPADHPPEQQLRRGPPLHRRAAQPEERQGQEDPAFQRVQGLSRPPAHAPAAGREAAQAHGVAVQDPAQGRHPAQEADPRLGLHRGERAQPCGARAGGEERRLRRPRRHEPRQRHGGGQLAPTSGLSSRPTSRRAATTCRPASPARTTRSSARSMATMTVPCYLNQNGCPPGSKFAYSNASDMTPNFNQARSRWTCRSSA